MGRFDTSIYNNPLKSISDYETELDKRDLSRQNLQMNKLKMDEFQRNVDQQNALRSLYGRLGADPQANYQSLLTGAGPKVADEYLQSITKADDMRAQAAEREWKVKKEKIGIIGSAAKFVMDNPTPENLTIGLKTLVDHGVMPADKAQQYLQQGTQNPALIAPQAQALFQMAVDADKQLPKLSNVNLGGSEGFFAQSQITGKVSSMGETPKTQSPDNAATNARTAADAAASRDIQWARLNFEKENAKAQPPVAVIDDSGNAKYVTREEALGKTPAAMGNDLSPKDKQKREAMYPTAVSKVKTFEQTSKELEGDLLKLADHPGLNSITGIAAGRLPGITAEGRAAEALYNKIQARGGFNELNSLRSAGGTLGQVSNAEGQFLRAAFAAIDRKQNAEDVRKAIADAVQKVRDARQNVRNEFDATYEYRKGSDTTPATPSVAKPTVSNW